NYDDGGTATESGTLGLDLEEYDIELNLPAAPGSASILPGTTSEVWRYKTEVLKGPETTVSENTGSYLGPTMRLRSEEVIEGIENAPAAFFGLLNGEAFGKRVVKLCA
ncbi:MAG: hypothetical protein WD251_00220, partial [Saccharospirillum sp.]